MSLRHFSCILALFLFLGTSGTGYAQQESAPAEEPAVSETTEAAETAADTTEEAAEESGDALDRALARGTLIVATELATPPWNFKDSKTKKATGFVIEMMEMFAKELGVELEVKDSNWKDVMPALTDGSADMLPWISRTVSRSTEFRFSDPYVNLPAQVLVRKGEVTSLMQLNSSDAIIGAKTGSIWETVARRQLPKAKVKTAATGARNIAALQSGKVDAYVNDKVQIIAAIAADPGGLEIIPEPIAMDSLAAAGHHDSPKLLHSFNVFLDLTKLDGRFAALLKKWLGFAWRRAIQY